VALMVTESPGQKIEWTAVIEPMPVPDSPLPEGGEREKR
jgi:hypothetical protein